MAFFGGVTDHTADITPTTTDPITGVLAGRGSNPDLSRTGGTPIGGAPAPSAGTDPYNPYTPSTSGAPRPGGASDNPYVAPPLQLAPPTQQQITANYQTQPIQQETKPYQIPPPPGTTPTSTSPTPGVTSPYGSNPFLSNPTVNQPNGTTANLNPTYYATQSTADQIAKQYGGTVVSTNPYGQTGGFSGNQAMLMVKLPNGTMVNPADIAALYTHGYSQPYIDLQLQTILNGGIGSPMQSGMSLDPSIANQFNVSSGGQPGTVNVGLTPYGQTGNPALIGQPGGSTGAPGTQQSGGQGAQTGQNQSISALLQALMGGQQQQAQDPFMALVSQLYGSNPFTSAFGNSPLASLLSGSSNQNNLGNIAQLLNAIYSQRTQPGTGVLSPLFWGSQGSGSQFGLGSQFNPLSNLYSQFY